MNRVEVKRSWWYLLLRSVSMFCFRFWWLVWVLFILFLICWFLFCFRSKNYTCELDKEINSRMEIIYHKLDSCCDCKTYVLPSGAKPCDYDEKRTGGQGLETNYHGLGEFPGMVYITYQMQNVPDRLDLYYDDKLVASTNGYVKGSGSLSFYYPAERGKPVFCKVVLSAPKSGTVWGYHIGCPR